MIIPIIPTFLRPSFYSSKKVAVSNTMLCRQKDALDGICRTCRVIGSDNEVQESYESTMQRAKDCLALIRKQREIVPEEEVQGVESSRITYHNGNSSIEVTPQISSFAREVRPGQRVRFIDEADVMTPRHIVTDTHYRPETVEEEKTLLYYSPEDYAQFALEDWRWKSSKEIKMLEELQGMTRCWWRVANTATNSGRRFAERMQFQSKDRAKVMLFSR